jgi:hypothetical protein
MWRAATIAGYLAATACGSAAPPAAQPVANETAGAGAALEARVDGECERTTDLPASVGAPKDGAFRAVVLGGDGRPVEGAAVSVGGGSTSERRGGRTITTIAGVAMTYSHADGGVRMESLMANMVNVTVKYEDLTVRCVRGSERDLRGYVLRVAPAI